MTVTSDSTGDVSGEAITDAVFTLLDLKPETEMYMGGAPDAAKVNGSESW